MGVPCSTPAEAAVAVDRFQGERRLQEGSIGAKRLTIAGATGAHRRGVHAGSTRVGAVTLPKSPPPVERAALTTQLTCDVSLNEPPVPAGESSKRARGLSNITQSPGDDEKDIMRSFVPVIPPTAQQDETSTHTDAPSAHTLPNDDDAEMTAPLQLLTRNSGGGAGSGPHDEMVGVNSGGSMSAMRGSHAATTWGSSDGSTSSQAAAALTLRPFHPLALHCSVNPASSSRKLESVARSQVTDGSWLSIATNNGAPLLSHGGGGGGSADGGGGTPAAVGQGSFGQSSVVPVPLLMMMAASATPPTAPTSSDAPFYLRSTSSATSSGVGVQGGGNMQTWPSSFGS